MHSLLEIIEACAAFLLGGVNYHSGPLSQNQQVLKGVDNALSLNTGSVAGKAIAGIPITVRCRCRC